nr:MAG TPA: hypothetical protein [Caudoviricetes sp.]
MPKADVNKYLVAGNPCNYNQFLKASLLAYYAAPRLTFKYNQPYLH